MFGPIRALTVGGGLMAVGFAMQPLQSIAADTAGPIRCELRESSAGPGVTLSAVVNASVSATGSYRLIVTKRGDAGGSDIDQSGGFSISPNGERVLSVVSTTLERGATYEAKLTVTWKGGTVSCNRTLPSAFWL